jgi:hypothetical protein
MSDAEAKTMALPYPHEVETGKLNPRTPEVRRPFDVAEHVARSLEVEDGVLLAFGVPLRPPAEERDVPELARRFRAALVSHFDARRPDADHATWDSFASQARAQLEQMEHADEEALRVLLLTIDGL